MRIAFFPVLFSFFLLPAHAGTNAMQEKKDSASILQRLLGNQSVSPNFFLLPYDNPALKYGMYDYTLNEISAGGAYRHESEPLMLQTGDGYRYGHVGAKSFIRKERSRMWGNASYRNGKQTNVQWNETADYLLLYPYVMGDTVGGDLNTEEYSFNGGYAGRAGRFIWGADAAYRATTGYRRTDPRPRNITGKLDFAFGAALTCRNGYRPGISVNVSRYKQKNVVKFYNEQGNPALYHFTGLGTDYYRFRGKEKETYYKGRQFGGSLNLLPVDGTGFTANVSFRHFRFEKIISALNELPMARADEYAWKAEAGYKRKSGNRTWGVRTEADRIHRKGTENLFGDPANDIYPQISSVPQYSNRITTCLLAGFCENSTEKGISWAIRPLARFIRIDTRYIYPARKQENERLQGAVALQAGKSLGKWLLRTEATVRYDASLQAGLQLPDDANEKMLVPLLSHYRFLATDHLLLAFGLRGDFAINTRCTLYLSTNWQSGRYTDNVRTDDITVAFGATF